MSQTLEQKRANFAYECVKDIKNLYFKEKFKSLVKKTPILILTNGFGNTMAFLFSKGEYEHLTLAYIVGRYLFKVNEYTKEIFGKQNIFNNDKNELFDLLKKLDKLKKDELIKKEIDKVKMEMQNIIFQNLIFTETDKYIIATEETLKFLNWLKKFTEAMIEVET
ncbi:MAG TPA: type III-B CRISPR module-associated protein Cmr5 [Hydrogenothermaceae bacterium]|nr:type III-B CRISPR module-associated protein Cmr5 [Hydrogenothermaceae bacterium]